MKWLWITALLFLVTGVKSGPPTRKVGNIVDTTITRIDRGGEGGKGSPDEFQFTLKDALTDVTGGLFLDVYADEMVEEPVEAKNKTQLKTPTFVTDLTRYSGKNTTFLIITFDGSVEPTFEANANIKSFPNFPLVKDTALLKDPRIPEPNNDKLFRVEGTLGDMHLETPPLVAQGDITYYSFSKDAPVVYVPCYKDDVVHVDVCDTELKHDDAPCEIEDTTVSSAVLAYGSDGNATIKLTFPVTAAAVTYEAILIPQPPQSPEKNVLCTDAEFPGATCIIKWSDPSSAVLQLIIIQKPTGQDPNPDTWVTSTFDIHDRELAVTQLGADIIEGRWLMLEGEYPSNEEIKSIYRLRKTVIDSNPLDYEDIEVDCSHLALEPRLCFGYFPHLALGTKHTLTVAYNGTGTADEMHQIESYPVTIKSPESELEILSRHTTTQQNQQRADVQVCFQHLTPTDGQSFSHYEMLIINEKGQWFKHSIMEEEEEEEASEERLCFAPFSISTNDFDLTEGTKVIISQRGADGITVLASGESRLF